MAYLKSESFSLNKKVSGYELIDKVEIRSLMRSDSVLMKKFNEQLALDSTNTHRYVGEAPISAEILGSRFAAQEQSPHSLLLGVFAHSDAKGCELVGMMGFVNSYPEHPWMKHVGHFFMGILKPYWGMGIASRLLEIQEQFARQTGITRIEATVRAQNSRAIELYARHGFIIEGTRKMDAYINGEYVDAFYIAKFLEPDTAK